VKVKLEGETFILVLDIGEEIISTLTSFVEEKHISAGWLSAIGALRDFELGYYYLDRKEYGRKKFEPIAELVSFHGNIGMREGRSFLHVHAALGREDYSLVAGHLFSGIVAVTAEVVLHPLPGAMQRAYDERTGLFLL
jgi:predicted DNA-binding protein with PD1-like motif